MKTLIGDDQAFDEDGGLSIIIMGFIEDYGHLLGEIEAESNPDEFVRKAKSGVYDAIFVDTNWCKEDFGDPIPTGYFLISKIKGSAKHIISWSTSNKEETYRMMALEFGATAAITKSPHPNALSDILNGTPKNGVGYSINSDKSKLRIVY